MLTTNLRKQSIKTLISLLNHTTQHPKPSIFDHHFPQNPINLPPNDGIHHKVSIFDNLSSFRESGFDCGRRWMSTSKGRSMRSKVERRMQKEAGKTVKQIRQAKKLKLKLMTEEERLLYSLRRAKKKVALLQQKLKKYELPELPPPRHDPELLTSEQLQAYKKIGFRNKNYCPVGVRGVFGGVVQNMHLHWKFHETVQVCCDNFPKEKIKEMAITLARLSGGIVVNIHNVKTIIMFRGRNYRQPKNLIPVNTLTKRKALFKARFEQALESQKLNIKKTEQQLRKKGISPDDPVAMASIQRVASTFFNAIDKKEGSPYVFREETGRQAPQSSQQSDPGEDSDQEELDKFIAEIEDAADKEWAEEEAAEKEELGRIRYWNKEDSSGRFIPERYRDNDSDVDGRGGARGFRDTYQRQRIEDSENEGGSDDPEGSDVSGDERDQYKHPFAKVERWNPEITRRSHENRGFKHTNTSYEVKVFEKGSGSEKTLDELDDGFDVDEGFSESEIPLFESDDDDDALETSPLRGADHDYSGTGEAPFYLTDDEDEGIARGKRASKKQNDEIWDSD
ncbi:hypothetical protein RND81_11G169700 [Saponaria officinalis]|uniref:CRM domain-containing protein n=1 Tax=Saponaria officinalis TaxID=3572 RepID=A0AAW1HM74_SAPOF